VFERALARLPDPGFLQIAGLKLSYSASADAGSRLRSLRLDDGTLISSDATTYIVAMSDRISAGADGYGVLTETSPTPSRDLVIDILAEYLKGKGSVTPTLAGRIVAVP
jgi:hypothetical protein